jgi:hypothetical protein
VDYAVNRKYFITRLLSPVKYGKKFVNGKIGPRSHSIINVKIAFFSIAEKRITGNLNCV